MSDFAKSANLSWNRRLMLTLKLAVTPLRSPPSPIGLDDSKAQTPLVWYRKPPTSLLEILNLKT